MNIYHLNWTPQAADAGLRMLRGFRGAMMGGRRSTTSCCIRGSVAQTRRHTGRNTHTDQQTDIDTHKLSTREMHWFCCVAYKTSFSCVLCCRASFSHPSYHPTRARNTICTRPNEQKPKLSISHISNMDDRASLFLLLLILKIVCCITFIIARYHRNRCYTMHSVRLPLPFASNGTGENVPCDKYDLTLQTPVWDQNIKAKSHRALQSSDTKLVTWEQNVLQNTNLTKMFSGLIMQFLYLKVRLTSREMLCSHKLHHNYRRTNSIMHGQLGCPEVTWD